MNEPSSIIVYVTPYLCRVLLQELYMKRYGGSKKVRGGQKGTG